MKKNSFVMFLNILFFTFAIYIGIGTVKFLGDRNKCYTNHFTIEDCKLNSIVQDLDGKYVCTDEDPSFEIIGECYVKNIKFYADYYVAPGEIVLYYAEDITDQYSQDKAVIAHLDSDGGYNFDIGGKNVHSVRIDPTSVAGNRISFGQIVVNSKISLSDYINFSLYVFIKLLFITAIINIVVTGLRH